MDNALKNAQLRREELLARVNELYDEIKKNYNEISKIDRFMADWILFSGEKNPEYELILKNIKSTVFYKKNEIFNMNDLLTKSKRRGFKNRKKEEICDLCIDLIRQKGKPMSRRELYERLLEKGIEVKGKNPEMVLSTMLWRTRSKISRLKTGGYWPREALTD